ncbi:MAG: B12-binding domain-containing radical SAM protein [Candidatus Eremiobacteraeota bacterium]|nr:B12-binding domain-containing radical SAM protein [Candidatus Eremiobacteraeota bacterium]
MSKAPVIFVLPRAPYMEALTHTLGMSYVRAKMKSEGIPSAILPQQDKTLGEFVSAVKEYNPTVIGITVYDPTYYLARMIARDIKKALPRVTIVVGGPTATFSDKLILEDSPWVDYCVRGEGEETFIELYRAIETGSSPAGIRGISYRADGEIIRNPDRPLITSGIKGAELDILPSPFIEGILRGDETYVGIQSSRGCAYRCIFCNGPSMFRNRVRYHSNQRVIRELEIIRKNMSEQMVKQRKVSLWDDNFCLDLDRTKKLVSDIIDADLGLRLYCELRADRVDLELLELLKSANFVHVNFGLESAVPRVLRIIKKLNPVGEKKALISEKQFMDKVRKSAIAAHRLGLNPSVSFISGLPGETPEEGRRTVEFVNSLPVHNTYHNHLVIFPGTELFDTYKDYGLKVDTGGDLLPYRVIMPYDSKIVPYSSRSSEFQGIYRSERYILDVVFGWWGDLTADKLNRPPLIVLWNRYDLTSEEIEWIKKTIRMAAPVFIVFDEFGRHTKAFLRLKNQLYPTVPTRSFYLLNRQKISNPKFKRYRLLINEEFRRACSLSNSFLLAPLKDYNNVRRDHGPGHIRRYPHFIFTIDDSEDFAVWEEFLADKNVNRDQTGLGKLANLNAVLLDGCRWGSRKCPAITLEKIHILPSGDLVPCANGGVIGKVGEPISTIQKRIEKLYKDEIKKRGCSGCPALNYCSQCLFPYPLTPDEYCELRRRFLNMGMEINQLDFLKDYDLKKQMNVIRYLEP